MQVGRFGISLFDGLGHRAVINHVAVAVEQVSVPGQPLVQGIDRRQRRFILDDEPQLFAADTVVFGRVLLYQRLAVFLGQRCLGKLRRDVIQPLRARNESLVELPQQFRLLRTFDRIVAYDAPHGIQGQFLAGGEEQRNAFAVIYYIIKRRGLRHALQLETIVTVLVEHRGVDHRLRQGQYLFQINILGIVTYEATRNLHLRRLACAQHDGRGQGHEKRLFIHLSLLSQLNAYKYSKIPDMRTFYFDELRCAPLFFEKLRPCCWLRFFCGRCC